MIKRATNGILIYFPSVQTKTQICAHGDRRALETSPRKVISSRPWTLSSNTSTLVKSTEARPFGTVGNSGFTFASRPRDLSTSSGASPNESVTHPITPPHAILDDFGPTNAPNPFFQIVTEDKPASLKSQTGTVIDAERKETGQSINFAILEDVAALVPPYLAPDQSVPAFNHKRKEFLRAKNIHGSTNDKRHGYLCDHILSVRDERGHADAARVLEAVLQAYVKTGYKSDWELVRQIYMFFCYHFLPTDLRAIRNSLVKSMLEEYPPRLEAISLLFEQIESDAGTSGKHIRSYLESFCNNTSEIESQLAEAEKILQGAQQTSDALKADIPLPVIRSAVAAGGDLDHAYRLVAQFHEDHNASIGFSVLSEFTKGYARQQNWSATDDLLAEIHRQGYSRSKPLAFAALVRTVFHFFAAAHQPERTFDFLTYLIQNHGLIPTTSLSISVLKYFVATKRYNIVQKWVHVTRVRFPSLLSSMRTPLAALEIGEAWSHSQVSPVDMLYTCKALAYDAMRDPFSDDFRHMVSNFLLSWLFKRTSAFILQNRIDKNIVGFKRFHDLESMHRCAIDLIHLMKQQGTDTRQSLLLDIYAKQVEATRQTDFLVNRFVEYIQQHGPILDLDEYQPSGLKPLKKTVVPPLPPRHILVLTGVELAKAVIHLYHNADSKEGRDNREVLVEVIRYLQRELRYRDCAILIQEIWESGCVTGGAFFTHLIIKTWVRLARDMGDPRLLRAALWAALDSDPTHSIGNKFLLLVRIAVSEVHQAVDRKTIRQYPNQLAELDYLVSRLYRRRWQQEGYPKAHEFADPHLRRWREGMDRSLADKLLPFVRLEYVE